MSERRRVLGLTQCEVVDRLNALGLDTSNRTLSAMEHGQGVEVGRLPEIAVALDCTVTYLLGLTGEPTRWTPDDRAVQRTGPVARLSEGPPGPEGVPGSPVGWILGPDVPDRLRPEPTRRA